MGGDYMSIPTDFDMKGVLFLSGRSSALLWNIKAHNNSVGDSYSWFSDVLHQPRYDRLRNYFYSCYSCYS